MIPILYEPTETAFTSNGLGRLADATECIIHEQRNGCFEMTIEMPTTGLHFSEIQKGSFIKATPSPTRSAQIFEVVRITKSTDGMMAEIYCQHISYRLNRIPVKPFTASSAWQALSRMISNSVETNPFTAYSDVTRTGTYKHNKPSSAKACLQGEAGSILQVYQGEYLFDNFQISLLANRGVDRGTEIRFGKNLLELEMEESLEGVITGIMPYWEGKSGETDVIMMLPEYVVYSSHASDFPNARTEVIDFSGDFDTKPTEANLRAAANAYITNNNIGVPKVDWDVEVATLAQTIDYSGVALLERMDLCDIVTIIFQDFGISVKAKIVETWYEPLKDRYQKVHIGDQRFTLAQTIASTAAQIEQSEAKQTTIFTQALEQATALLNGDLSGSSLKTITDSNGNPTGLIIMDTTDPQTAINCIRINASGIGFSNSGPSGPYTSAWTIDNTLNMHNVNAIHIDASAIDTGTLSADYISGGTIDSSTINIGNGVFTVNSAGKVEASNFNMSGGKIDIMTGGMENSIIDIAYTGTSVVTDSIITPSSISVSENSTQFGQTVVGLYTDAVAIYRGIGSSQRRVAQIAVDSDGYPMIVLTKPNGNMLCSIYRYGSLGVCIDGYNDSGNLAFTLDKTGLYFSGGNSYRA